MELRGSCWIRDIRYVYRFPKVHLEGRILLRLELVCLLLGGHVRKILNLRVSLHFLPYSWEILRYRKILILSL